MPQAQSQEADIHTIIQQLKAKCGTAEPSDFRKLEAEADRLTTEIEVLRMAGASEPACSKWHAYGLTEAEINVITILERAGDRGVNKESIHSIMFAGRPVDEWPELKIIDVYMCKIRPKLIKHNAPYWIETIWGRGYRLRNEHMPTGILNRIAKQRFSRRSMNRYVAAA